MSKRETNSNAGMATMFRLRAAQPKLLDVLQIDEFNLILK